MLECLFVYICIGIQILYANENKFKQNKQKINKKYTNVDFLTCKAWLVFHMKSKLSFLSLQRIVCQYQLFY